MTVPSHPHTRLLSDSPPAMSVAHPSDTRAAWRTWAILVVCIGALYMLMWNPYWVPGGDSELYVAVARSWAMGQRHTFNGQFVSMSPPGWPLVLAAAMKISPSFAFLKLITIASMTFALGLWYWFLLRFTTNRRAVLLTLLTAISGHVYTLTFWMHSDAFFCLIATAAMVIACQINERRSHMALRIVALALLCIAAQLVRWAGVLQWLIIAGLLIRGYPIPITRKRMTEFRARFITGPTIALLVTCIVTGGTFKIVRDALQLTKEQKIAAEEAGATFDEQQQPQAPIEARAP